MNKNRSESCKNNICIITSSPLAVRWHISPHLENLSRYCNITILTADIIKLNYINITNKNIIIKQINIGSKINVFKDILLLIKLYFLLNNNFHAIITMTPKAGLLGMVSSFLVNIKVRVHIFTGQVWYNKNGLFKYFLILIDYIIGALATNIICDSKSQLDLLISRSIIKKNKSVVIGSGSVVGVNIDLFHSNITSKIFDRNIYKFNETDLIFIYLGRVNVDKGIFDLLNAYNIYTHSYKSSCAKLLVVGPLELSKIDTFKFHKLINQSKSIYVPYTNQPERYINLSDVLFLPSYREGFGNVIIEAASFGLPSVASNISGITDAVVDGVTGILHKPGSINEIVKTMYLLSDNIDLRINLGVNAKNRAHKNFSQKIVIQNYFDYYKSINLVTNNMN